MEQQTQQTQHVMTQERPRYIDAQGRIINWTEFFKEERDIYVRNLTETNISLMFGSGPNIFYVTVPMSPDPMNLTSEVSFADIKSSQDFRKIANARQAKTGRPYVQIMTEAEFRQYYDDRARAMRVTAEEAIARAERARSEWRDQQRANAETGVVSNPEPIHRVVEQGSGPGGATHMGEKQRVAPTTGFINEDELIRDRLRALMFDVRHSVLEEQKHAQGQGRPFDASKVPTAESLLKVLVTMQDLTEDELEHIRSKGYWPSIKRWAGIQLDRVREVPSAAEAPVSLDDGDAFLQRQGMVE